jgi:thiamine-monophosphate kinase
MPTPIKEFDILHAIYSANPALPPSVTIPPGDDMGELTLTSGSRVLVTVDQIAEGRHFVLKETPLALIARKALARNLSDVAAMAAKPMGCVCAAALPRNFSLENAKRLSECLRDSALAFDCPMFGGDVTIWDYPILISVTVLAEPWLGIRPVRRAGAKPGDLVCVSGTLGGSIITNNGYTHHLEFTPRISFAKALATRVKLSSMIDISDGLGRDAGHIAEQSGVDITLYANRLPCSTASSIAAQSSGKPAWLHALSDGEDYELCFTVSDEESKRLAEDHWTVDGVRVTPVGYVSQRFPGKPHVQVITPDSQIIDASTLGWEHA